MIEIGIGLLIIAIGSFGQSSSYVPINKIRDWSWESFWLVQGIFAWLVFPYLGGDVGRYRKGVPCWSYGVRRVAWERLSMACSGVLAGYFRVEMRYLGRSFGDRASPWVHAPVSVRSSRLCSVERICLREPD